MRKATNEEGKRKENDITTHHGVAWCCASRVMHLLKPETPTGCSHRLSYAPRLSRILWCATIGRDPPRDCSRIFAYETHRRGIRKPTSYESSALFYI